MTDEIASLRRRIFDFSFFHNFYRKFSRAFSFLSFSAARRSRALLGSKLCSLALRCASKGDFFGLIICSDTLAFRLHPFCPFSDENFE